MDLDINAPLNTEYIFRMQRRRKAMYIPQELVSELILQGKSAVRLRISVEIPKTSTLLSVSYVPERMSFLFVYEDESFEEAEVGCLLPEVYYMLVREDAANEVALESPER